MNKKLNSNLFKLAVISAAYIFMNNSYWCAPASMYQIYAPNLKAKCLKSLQYAGTAVLLWMIFTIPTELFDILTYSSNIVIPSTVISVPVPGFSFFNLFNFFRGIKTEQSAEIVAAKAAITQALAAAQTAVEQTEVVMKTSSINLISLMVHQSTIVKVILTLFIVLLCVCFDLLYAHVSAQDIDVVTGGVPAGGIHPHA